MSKIDFNGGELTLSIDSRTVAKKLCYDIYESIDKDKYKINFDFITGNNGCYIDTSVCSLVLKMSTDYDYHNNIYKHYQDVQTITDEETVEKLQTIINLNKIYHIF